MAPFALITGASTGIGRALAIELGKLGWTVGLVARRTGELETTGNLVLGEGGRGVVLSTDLTDLQQINRLITSVVGLTTHLDLLVNIAAIWHGKSEVYAGKNIQDFDHQVIAATYQVGLIAPTILASGLVSLMPPGSSIINLSGTFETGAKGWLPYYASKRALEDLTIGLAEELAEKQIKVNCISPSDVATEEYQKYFPQDAQNALSPQEVAKFIIEVSQKSQTGQVWVIKKDQSPYPQFH